MLQLRMSQDDSRLYSVNRDVAHNFQFVAMEVARRLSTQLWPELSKLLADAGVDQEQLGTACAALCAFVAGALERPEESMEDCLRRSGFLSARPEAQVAVMACLGQVMAGVYWGGVREATAGGGRPRVEARELANAGAECIRLMSGR